MCDKTFDFRAGVEPLGPQSTLWTEIRKAAEGAEPVTLAELTRLAGWAEGTWDRMVHVPADATAAELNAASGISDFCWSNMPQSWSISVEQTIRDGNLLFVPGTTPLQSVFVSDISRTIELGDNPLEVVHPNTLLTPKDHYSGRRLTTVE